MRTWQALFARLARTTAGASELFPLKLQIHAMLLVTVTLLSSSGVLAEETIFMIIPCTLFSKKTRWPQSSILLCSA